MTDDSKDINNFPILQGTNDVIQCNFDFNERFYDTFQEFISRNPGKTTYELCEIITFYDFTEKTLDIAFRLFNTWKNTYYGRCGPFMCKNYRWFVDQKYTDTCILAQENSSLRIQLAEYKKLLSKVKNDVKNDVEENSSS
jgi:hypothetical protein